MAKAQDTETTSEQQAERPSGIGRDEAWTSNLKRTYDEFQQESLESIRQQRALYASQMAELRATTTKMMLDAQGYDGQRQALSLQTLQIGVQALQNAVETANMVGKNAVISNANVHQTEDLAAKQAVAHRDLAVNTEWQGAQAAQVDTSAIDAAVAKAVQGHERAMHSAPVGK